MRSVVRTRRPIVLAAAVVAIEGVGLSIWEFANAFGPPAAGITGTVVARAIAATAFVVGPTAGWQIQQQRRWAYRVGLTLTSLVVAGLAGVAAVEVSSILRFFLVALNDFSALAAIKGVVRYQLPQLVPIFALTIGSGFGLRVLLRSGRQAGSLPAL